MNRVGFALLVSLFLWDSLRADTPRPDEAGRVGPGVPSFTVRDGYQVKLAAENFGAARHLELGDDGTLYVTQPQQAQVAALKDKDGDGVYETHTTFLTGMKDCEGVAFDGGWLYVTSAADGSVKRAKDTTGTGKADQIETVLPPGSVPGGGGHAYRGIAISKDYMYITVSDPGNMSDDLPSPRKCVYRFNRDGSGKMQFSTGIRNTEKIRLRPGTEEIWGLDHGSDNFGGMFGEKKDHQPMTDLLPGEELNKFVEGGFYGHPFICNNRIPRPEYAKRPDIDELAAKTIPPEWTFGAHWAPNGFAFLTKDTFPAHKGDLIAAFHGSWNSSLRVGYCVERVLFDQESGKPYGALKIVSTLAPGENGGVLARPVDCTEAADGTILFSCDMTNKIYRISPVAQ